MAKKKKLVTKQPQGDSKSVKKKRRKKKKLQKYQASVPTKDIAMPIQSDSDVDDDSSSGETKPEKIQKLFEPYTRYQRINFLVGAAVPDAFLFTHLRDAADRDISCRKLVVYSLTWDTTRETLVSAFESYDEIEDCNVIFDRDMGKTKGYSFVQFKTKRAAAKAFKQPRKKIRNLMSRTADLVTSKEGIVPMIGAPLRVQPSATTFDEVFQCIFDYIEPQVKLDFVVPIARYYGSRLASSPSSSPFQTGLHNGLRAHKVARMSSRSTLGAAVVEAENDLESEAHENKEDLKTKLKELLRERPGVFNSENFEEDKVKLGELGWKERYDEEKFWVKTLRSLR